MNVVDTDTATTVLYDVMAGRSEADSRLTYTPTLRKYRAVIEAEWQAWSKEHPDAVLSVPTELPRSDITVTDAKAADVKEVDLEERDFSAKKRSTMADAGTALPDGSFPIANKSDLANAISAIGRAKDYDRAKAHIIKRARALGAVASLPTDWGIKEAAHLTLGDRLALNMSFADTLSAADWQALAAAGHPVVEVDTGHHFYGAWLGGGATKGGHPAGKAPPASTTPPSGAITSPEAGQTPRVQATPTIGVPEAGQTPTVWTPADGRRIAHANDIHARPPAFTMNRDKVQLEHDMNGAALRRMEKRASGPSELGANVHYMALRYRQDALRNHLLSTGPFAPKAGTGLISRLRTASRRAYARQTAAAPVK